MISMSDYSNSAYGINVIIWLHRLKSKYQISDSIYLLALI